MEHYRKPVARCTMMVVGQEHALHKPEAPFLACQEMLYCVIVLCVFTCKPHTVVSRADGAVTLLNRIIELVISMLGAFLFIMLFWCSSLFARAEVFFIFHLLHSSVKPARGLDLQEVSFEENKLVHMLGDTCARGSGVIDVPCILFSV